MPLMWRRRRLLAEASGFLSNSPFRLDAFRDFLASWLEAAAPASVDHAGAIAAMIDRVMAARQAGVEQKPVHGLDGPRGSLEESIQGAAKHPAGVLQTAVVRFNLGTVIEIR
jgi:hypothetical protein